MRGTGPLDAPFPRETGFCATVVDRRSHEQVWTDSTKSSNTPFFRSSSKRIVSTGGESK